MLKDILQGMISLPNMNTSIYKYYMLISDSGFDITKDWKIIKGAARYRYKIRE